MALPVGGAILGLLGLKYGVPNVRYFGQMIWLGYKNSFHKGDVLPSEGSSFEFTVSLTDIDFMRHMNNAAYLRYAEAGRHEWFWKLLARDDFKQKFSKNGYGVPLVAVTVKYRRECKFNHTLILKTEPVYWNATSVYLKQSFYHKETGLLHCILYAKLALTKDGKFVKTLGDKQDGYHLLTWYGDIDDKTGNNYECRNELTKDISAWMRHLNATKDTKLKSKL